MTCQVSRPSFLRVASFIAIFYFGSKRIFKPAAYLTLAFRVVFLALSREQNSPQQCAYGLYTEQLAATASVENSLPNPLR